MFTGAPSEIPILGLYFPPLIVAIVAGLVCATLIARLLNQSGLSVGAIMNFMGPENANAFAHSRPEVKGG
jgi:hypothetical protein